MSLAAEQPVSDSLAELLADTMSPPLREGGFVGATPTIVRPRPEELATAWRNIAALNFDPLAASYPEGLPADAIGEVERILASIADIDEAAAAFCLPYASPGIRGCSAESAILQLKVALVRPRRVKGNPHLLQTRDLRVGGGVVARCR